MSGRVLRWQVPIDDRDHLIVALEGEPGTHYAVTADGFLEFWTFSCDLERPANRTFRVFGTGHLVPTGYEWRGTAARVSGLVFHLFERVDR